MSAIKFRREGLPLTWTQQTLFLTLSVSTEKTQTGVRKQVEAESDSVYILRSHMTGQLNWKKNPYKNIWEHKQETNKVGWQ